MLLDQRPVADTLAADGSDLSERSLDRLVHAIEDEIIPRLVLARRGLPAGPSGELERQEIPGSDEVREFVRLVLSHDVGVAAAYIDALRARGVALETVYLDLLAPTARLLGDLWSNDLCDFTEVTVGVWRLHQLVRELSPEFRADLRAGEDGRRALLVAIPGEQHTFGLVLLAEFFRRSGWDVWSGPVASGDELRDLVRSERFAVVGLSVGGSGHVQGLAAEIQSVRRASRNRAVGVMVGGPLFIDHPELVGLVGADATAVDGRQATQQAEGLMALAARRC
jgi:methanogenic corrinoid protein MtbC1